MKEFIEPYQYNFIKNQLANVSRAYRSANDTSTLKALKSLTEEKINELFPESVLEEHKKLFSELHVITSTKEAEPFLEGLKTYVIPFAPPSDVKLKKLFAKTKKLKIPAWSKLDLRDYTFYGWNDIAQKRKYIVTYEDGNLVGVQGTISTEIQKGFARFAIRIRKYRSLWRKQNLRVMAFIRQMVITFATIAMFVMSK